MLFYHFICVRQGPRPDMAASLGVAGPLFEQALCLRLLFLFEHTLRLTYVRGSGWATTLPHDLQLTCIPQVRKQQFRLTVSKDPFLMTLTQLLP